MGARSHAEMDHGDRFDRLDYYARLRRNRTSSHRHGEGLANSRLQHLIFIVQENHSFDNYFGTFPGANGLPSGISVPFDATGRT